MREGLDKHGNDVWLPLGRESLEESKTLPFVATTMPLFFFLTDNLFL